MSPIFDESDAGDLDNTECEPVVDADWEQSAAAVEPEERTALDAAGQHSAENPAGGEEGVDRGVGVVGRDKDALAL